MGNNSVKKGYYAYPTCCDDKSEVPKTYDGFKKLLKYIQACQENKFEHFEYLRNFSEFNFANITIGLLGCNLSYRSLMSILDKYDTLPWVVDILYNGININKGVLPPAMVSRRLDLAWNFRIITKKYWPQIVIYDLPWDLDWVERNICVFPWAGGVCESVGGIHAKLDVFYGILIRHTEHRWHFRDTYTDNFVLKSITCKTSPLYGYKWRKTLLGRACRRAVEKTVYSKNLEPWILDPKLYKPTKNTILLWKEEE